MLVQCISRIRQYSEFIWRYLQSVIFWKDVVKVASKSMFKYANSPLRLYVHVKWFWLYLSKKGSHFNIWAFPRNWLLKSVKFILNDTVQCASRSCTCGLEFELDIHKHQWTERLPKLVCLSVLICNFQGGASYQKNCQQLVLKSRSQ